MSDMHGSSQEYLKNFGVDFNINKMHLKRELFKHFETSAVQEQSDGKNVLLVFMHESDYRYEALQSLRIASDICREIFAHEHFNFSGSFPLSLTSPASHCNDS